MPREIRTGSCKICAVEAVGVEHIERRRSKRQGLGMQWPWNRAIATKSIGASVFQRVK
jgi:hypothetical protein